jgi:hypothetical protein
MFDQRETAVVRELSIVELRAVLAEGDASELHVLHGVREGEED